MHISKAIEVIEQFGSNTLGTGDVLATIKYMDATFDDLSQDEQTALSVFMDVGRKFFSPKEEV
jgi:phage-related minor tail protein